MTRTIFIIFISFSSVLLRAQEDWELVKDKNEIQVFTRSSENFNFKTFRAHVVLETSIHSFVAVLHDIENFKDWGYKVIDASVLKRIGDTLQIYYLEAKAPFPYKNRDGIYLNRFKWRPESNSLTVDIEVLDTYLEMKDKFVRVKGEGFWKVTVLPMGRIDITFQMQLDPGGNVPSWMANIFVDQSPYHTLLNLKSIIKKDKYLLQRFEFLD